jgi:hypothetical protein
MEPFTINLNQTEERGGRYKRFLLMLGLLFVTLSIISYFLLHRKGNPNEWIFIVIGIYVIVFIYFAFVGYKTKLYITCDDYALEYQFGFFKKVPGKVIWQTLVKVKLGPTYLAFFKRTGKRKLIQIGWLPYAKVKEIKCKVQEVCVEKGIELEIAEYHTE